MSQEGVADPEDIDKAITLGLNWPMGPLRLVDYVGADTHLFVTNVLVNETGDPKFRPSNLLRQMVAPTYWEGRLGTASMIGQRRNNKVGLKFGTQ